jgi:hypothetical protein
MTAESAPQQWGATIHLILDRCLMASRNIQYRF